MVFLISKNFYEVMFPFILLQMHVICVRGSPWVILYEVLFDMSNTFVNLVVDLLYCLCK